MEDKQEAFANTHFEEWWFKTFLYEVRQMRLYKMNTKSQLRYEAGFIFFVN
jgi:hypothetical protein